MSPNTAVFILCCALVAAVNSSPFNPDLDSIWTQFKESHGKQYPDRAEEGVRRLIWEENVKKIAIHNLQHDLGLHTYTLGLNQFADWGHQEFLDKMTGLRRRSSNQTSSQSGAISTFLPLAHVTVPDTVDWRTEGYVTPIKNQGSCGSCWAFSTTGSLEGQHKRKTGQLVSLSEQNLVDCSFDQGNFGCSGGLMDQGFTYIKDNGGIDTEESYPYEAQDDTCRYKKSTSGATLTGFVDIKSGDEVALQQAVATIGPISVAIDAAKDSFQLYKSGVYVEPYCSTVFLDHGVLAVGYGTTQDGQDYWLVKNSWGTTWGIEGYIMMARNKGNQCGIATDASYPLV